MIDSAVAEETLTNQLLLDREGCFWTIGFQSGRWYSFEASHPRWLGVEGPPEASTLLKACSDPSECSTCGRQIPGDKFCRYCGQQISRIPATLPVHLEAPVEEFMAKGWNTLPEPVTADWEPPAGYPEMPVTCSVCGLVHARGETSCLRCRAALSEEAPRVCGNPQCGKRLSHGTRFCQHCGQRTVEKSEQPHSSQEQTCPNRACGRQIEAGKKFCPACGAPLSG